LENAQELVEGFHQNNPDMLSGAVVQMGRKVFLMWTSQRMRFFTLPFRVQKGFHLFLENDRRKILKAFEDEAEREGARVRHTRRRSLPLLNKDL